MPYLIFVLSFILLWVPPAYAQNCSAVPIDQFKEWSEKTFCNQVSAPSTFILIDGSDPISEQSKTWLKKNIFLNRNLTHFDEAGSRLTVAYMADQPVADLVTTSICHPTPPEKVNIILESTTQARKAYFDYGCAVAEAHDRLLEERTETGKSLIIEAVKEIFNNPRYNQVNNSAARKFVLASDLYQHSTVVNFFELCVFLDDGSRKCPGFNELRTAGGRMAMYLEAALPKLRNNDEVFIYNFNVDGKFDQSARRFWEEYFVAAGVPFENINYFVELDQH